MNNITYRLANLQDFDDVKSLMLNALKSDTTAFSASFDEYNSRDYLWWREYISPFLRGIDSQMILAVDNESVVGFIGVLFERKERKKHISTFVWFYVLPSHRKIGIGLNLIQQATDVVDNKKFMKTSLMVNSNQQSAINLYKKFNFQIAGTLQKEMKIEDIFYDILIMEKFN